jgi:hypothetical protein
LSAEPFDPYDDTVPVGERLGSQPLYSPRPDQEVADRTVAKIPRGKPRKPERQTPQAPPLSLPQLPPEPVSSKPKFDSQEWVSTMVETLGLAAFSAGWWFIPGWPGIMLGCIFTGLCLVLIGVATSKRLGGPTD